MDAIIETLRRVDLLHGLSPLQLTEILRNSDRVVFNPGDVLLERGEICDHATLIVDGDAVCSSGHVEPLTDGPLPPGTILAELAMVVEIESAATVVAETRVRAIRLVRSAILTQMAADPTIAEHMIERISLRLRHAAEYLQAIEREIDGGGESAAASAQAHRLAPMAGQAHAFQPSFGHRSVDQSVH